MIPDDFAIKSAEKKEFDLLPEDTYEVVIEQIELREDQPVYQSDEVEDKLSFTFKVTEEGVYKGRKMWKDVTPVMSTFPSWLYKIFCAVNQVQLNDEEAQGISTKTINDMEGKPLRLVVKQKPNTKGITKNIIADVLPTKIKPVLTTPVESNLTEFQPGDIRIDDSDIPF